MFESDPQPTKPTIELQPVATQSTRVQSTPVVTPKKRGVNPIWIAGSVLVLLTGICAMTLFVSLFLFSASDRLASGTKSDAKERYSAGSAANRSLLSTAATPVVVIATPEGGIDYETAVLTNIYAQVNPSVVNVTVLSDAESQDLRLPFGGPGPDDLFPVSSGSGFVWDVEGHIVTNNHVVDDAKQIQIQFSDGTVSIGEVVGTDVDSDIAVVRIDPEGYALHPVQRGRADTLVVGTRVAAIGNPFGLEGTLTSGIVSAIGRSIPSQSQFSIPGSIQTDAAINPGNSGGPLLNEQAQVIGINAQIQSTTRSNSGIGFAIPIDIVERVVPALIADGEYKHSFLGVRGGTYSPICSEDLALGKELRGALIGEVVPRTPAARAGLQGASRDSGTDLVGICPDRAGGDLIIAIDEQPVTAFDDILIYLERYTSPGTTITLTVLRDGETLDIEATLAARSK